MIWRPGPGDTRYVELFAHGSQRLKLYAPRGHDPQSPHDQDELYIVQRGSGRFRSGAQVCDFYTGDVLCVAAGVEHRFEDLWVMFYGPEGGESCGQDGAG